METENKWLVASSQCLWDCGSSSTDAQGKHFHELLKQQKLVFLWLQHPSASHAGSVHAIFHIGRICPVPRSLNTRNCSPFKKTGCSWIRKVRGNLLSWAAVPKLSFLSLELMIFGQTHPCCAFLTCNPRMMDKGDRPSVTVMSWTTSST